MPEGVQDNETWVMSGSPAPCSPQLGRKVLRKLKLPKLGLRSALFWMMYESSKCTVSAFCHSDMLMYDTCRPLPHGHRLSHSH